jgi:hypothetical protein
VTAAEGEEALRSLAAVRVLAVVSPFDPLKVSAAPSPGGNGFRVLRCAPMKRALEEALGSLPRFHLCPGSL